MKKVDNIEIIHHSTSSIIEIKIIQQEPTENGNVENKIDTIWLDYNTYNNLKKCININDFNID